MNAFVSLPRRVATFEFSPAFQCRDPARINRSRRVATPEFSPAFQCRDPVYMIVRVA